MSVQHYRNGRAAVIEIDRPPVNAINQDIRAGLIAALTAIDGDAAVERIILSGAKNVFAAGADAGEFGLPMVQPDLPTVVAVLEASKVPAPWKPRALPLLSANQVEPLEGQIHQHRRQPRTHSWHLIV